jgi:CheY-like chemotaxis protein
MQRDHARNVLVVGPDEDVRDQIGEWLEGAGFEVAGCPGPMKPEYSCVGSRTWMCPLEAEADVVVLDLCLASDLAMEGTPSEELLAFYVWKGRPVVALAHEALSLVPLDPDLVTVITAPPTPDSILGAVRGRLVDGSSEVTRITAGS